ncbi:MAG TPA: hypothetical protein VFA27_00405 [Vicinamibacterales bacterium]|nr:hypothetical protein [Vicinamibacterales bacterium]
MASHGVRHFVAATALIALACYVFIYSRGWADAPIRSDGYSYYVYLPSAFIYHDLSMNALAQDWYGGEYPAFAAIRRWPTTNRWLDATPIGVALLMLPFFLAADALTWWSNLPRDGFSFYYQHAAALSGLACFVAGLAIVRALLRRHFSDGVVLATLVTITWGTNLFHYGTFDATFSHAFSFFLVAAWIALVERWRERATAGSSAALGAVAALIVLTRNVNALFLLVLPLRCWRELWPRRALIALAVVTGALCLLPQALLYRYITGAWWVNSYALLNNRFNFGAPRIASVLFSPQKGLFFWSPALALAVVGALVARGWSRRLVAAAAIIFPLQLYIVASWSDWQLGGSYGHRAFTDGFALAAPLVASAYEWSSTRPCVRVFVAVFASAAVALSILQMIQYWLGIIPFANTTWTQYRDLFLRFW